jgi:hypothetical protein
MPARLRHINRPWQRLRGSCVRPLARGLLWPISGFAGLIDRLGLMLADLAARDTRVTRHAVRLALAAA